MAKVRGSPTRPPTWMRWPSAVKPWHRQVAMADVEPTCSKVPRARLLAARLALLGGDFNRARVAVSEIRELDRAARESEDPDAVLDRRDSLLFEALALGHQAAQGGAMFLASKM